MIFFQVLLVLVLPGIKTTFHSPICIEMYLKVRSLQKSSGYGLQLIESEWNLAPLPLRHVYIHDLESVLFRVGPRFDIKDREWKAGNKALADYEITQLRVLFRKNKLWFLKKDLEMKGTQCDECRLQSPQTQKAGSKIHHVRDVMDSLYFLFQKWVILSPSLQNCSPS